MCLRRLVLLLGWTACYDAPTGAGPCSITCDLECPGDLVCENGFCIAEGDEACAVGFVAISTGGGFSCAIDEQSDLSCWGSNDRHQIDPGDQPRYPKAHKIAGNKYRTVSAGRGHVCAITLDDELFCWGANEASQIAGTVAGDVLEPTRIEGTGLPTTWSEVSAGFQNTCAISGDRRLFCWGRNNFGAVGNNTQVDAPQPTPVMTTLEDWSAVKIGGGTVSTHACAISESAGLHCWGANDFLQLTKDAAIPQLVPHAIALPGADAIAIGQYHTCATAAGELYCWGYSGYASLGDPAAIPHDGSNVDTPTLATLLAGGWTDVDAGEIVTCGQRGDEVYCWGYSRTGTGVGGGYFKAFEPTVTQTVARGAEQMSVAANEFIDRSGIVMTDAEGGCYLSAGAVRCWGDNRFGQLGQGTATESAEPLEITGGHVWTQLSTGLNHACGLDDTGSVACWGQTLLGCVDGNITGRVDTPCTTNACDSHTPRTIGSASDLAIGAIHTCVLDGDKVSCWGDNGFRQHGAASTPPKTMVPGSYTELFESNGVGTCAREASGVACWGNLTDPTVVPELGAMTTISIGGVVAPSYFGVGCFLDGQGALFCTGDNSLAQFGNYDPGGGCGDGICNNGETSPGCADCGSGTFSTNFGRTYQAISAGWDVDNNGVPFCGVTPAGTVECWGRNPNAMLSQEIDVNTGLPFAYVGTPATIGGLASCTQVAVGRLHACALCDGDILCWGDHLYGAVGSGLQTPMPVLVPRSIARAPDPGDPWVQLTSSAHFTCARTEAGRGFCWGSSAYGATGFGVPTSTLPILVLAE